MQSKHRVESNKTFGPRCRRLGVLAAGSAAVQRLEALAEQAGLGAPREPTVILFAMGGNVNEHWSACILHATPDEQETILADLRADPRYQQSAAIAPPGPVPQTVTLPGGNARLELTVAEPGADTLESLDDSASWTPPGSRPERAPLPMRTCPLCDQRIAHDEGTGDVRG